MSNLRGIVNCNKDGVAFGVGTHEEVPDWFWEQAETLPEVTCPACGEPEPVIFQEPREDESSYKCLSCGERGPTEDCYSDGPLFLSTDTFEALCSDGVHVWVFRSPRIVKCRECSPCFPGAGDLGTVGKGTLETFGFPEEEEEI